MFTSKELLQFHVLRNLFWNAHGLRFISDYIFSRPQKVHILKFIDLYLKKNTSNIFGSICDFLVPNLHAFFRYTFLKCIKNFWDILCTSASFSPLKIQSKAWNTNFPIFHVIFNSDSKMKCLHTCVRSFRGTCTMDRRVRRQPRSVDRKRKPPQMMKTTWMTTHTICKITKKCISLWNIYENL